MVERKRQCSSDSASTSTPPKKVAIATTNSPNIPLELIVEILSKLPVKSAFRFRCVCKLWDTLFDDTHFLNKHMHHMHTHTNPKSHLKILMIGQEERYTLQSIPISTLRRGKAKPQHLPFPNLSRKYGLRMIGSFNGMVCLRVLLEEGETIYFWNPLTNQHIQLPYTFSLSHHFNIFGFGFDDSINEFKLVRLFSNLSKDANKYSVEVYGMWEGSRRRISDHLPFGCPRCSGMYGHSFSAGVYLNGAFHWVAVVSNDSWDSWAIVALDLAKETFRQVLLPKPDCEWEWEWEWEDMSLYCVGELLCVMINYHQSHDDVWIMKEYGVRESWVKMVTIPYVPSVSKKLITLSLPLYFSESEGEFFMIYNGKLVLYNSREKSIRDLEIDRDFKHSCICFTYVDTIFTPNVMMRLRGESYNKHTRLKVKSRDWDSGVIAYSVRA